MKTLRAIICCAALGGATAQAENFGYVTTSGAITTNGPSSSSYVSTTGAVASGTYIVTTGSSAVSYMSTAGSVYAGSYIQSNGNITAATYLTAGSYIYSSAHLQAATYVQAPTGLFTNQLKTGGSTANGSLATGLGASAAADSYSSVVVGRNNVPAATGASDGGAVTAGSWVDKDPLFVIGNGTGVPADPVATRNRNAFTVYKDGTITMSKAQGDISMGNFGN